MPSETRLNTPFATTLDLPPGFRVVTLREVGDAFAHAKANAAELGAGALVFVGRFDLAEFAVVLEPDEPLRTARRAFYAGMAALSDALAAHAPPEKPIACVWPDSIYVDQGLVGGAQFAWSDSPEDQPPDWLVFGGMIRTVAMTAEDAGLHPLETALDQEGFEEHGASALVESFARHFMAAIDAWEQDGFGALMKEYLSRLSPEKGARRDIDQNGDLVVSWAASSHMDRRPLVPALQTPSWYDAKRGGPR
jgi:biotin-(acetyl-CoA carboxylase) ligase